MAEGHAVIRWARALQVLVGEPLTALHLPKRWGERAEGLVGQYLTGIETHGKVLLLHLSGGETLLCHAMQYGSWQIGEAGMELRKEAKYVRLRLVTTRHEAVFYHGPIIELLTPEELALNERLQTLGPDVMAADFDRDEAWARLHLPENIDREIGDLVLDQRIMAGVGNIYKSEGLFLAKINPCRTAREIGRDEIERYWDAVIPLMWQGTESYGPTTTLPAEQQAQHPNEFHWVYRRRGRPCFCCGTAIKRIEQGKLKRATFFCPVCQPGISERTVSEDSNKSAKAH